MRLRSALVTFVAGLTIVVGSRVSATSREQSPCTVLATMQPGVDLWMPVSCLVPPDAQSRVWWGNVPIQTHQTGWMIAAQQFAINSTLSVTVTDATGPSSPFVYTTLPGQETHGFAFSANGWVTGPGQVIYYGSRAADGGRHRLQDLRTPGTIGSIFGTIAAGTVLHGAKQYLIAWGIPMDPPRHFKFSGRTTLEQEIPAGAVITSSPQ
jgi:hypothetical protein